MTRTHPWKSLDEASFTSTVSILSKEKDEVDCCESCSGACCSRRCVCISVIALLLLGVIAAVIACAVILGIPKRSPGTRQCITADNQTGFLCDDAAVCIEASQVCDRIKSCGNGEDEETVMCSDLPNNLPSYLIFRCGDPQNWIFINQKCNGFNNCGDCSDEIGTLSDCSSSCGPRQWSCTSIFHQYCTCIPRSLCRDRTQHCADWSDEFVCPK
ncbi:low-density lipoprotein receptor class A domain-containing protein 1 [Microcaecilia unicolor]|uniref:Low-density lipoprotein receptor class A domain-containing protein 1 n=1 Tax=Microcaecilia unicolor TaxID=1415580 RepID=A0A6P7Y9V5_9AMPH|nr:low-density lipoprotein receptor class A domain-containing protein 1 [Microcaecilia unicolor]